MINMSDDVKKLIHEYTEQKGKEPLPFSYDKWDSFKQYKEYLLKELLNNENIILDEPMSKHTSFKTGGNADIFIKADTVDKLKNIIEFSKKINLPLFILGNGSNILVTDKGIRGIVCKIEIKKFEIEEKENDIFVTVGSGNKNAEIAQNLLKQEIEGFEFASGIPGSIGGAIKMNAGAYGSEMKDITYSTVFIDRNCNIHKINQNEHEFDYRKSIFSNRDYIILESTLKLRKGNKNQIENKMKEYMKLRKEKQPFDKPSAGSTFKRGENFITSKIIDECGLKGKQIGGAKISEKHAGFIINTGNASSDDIIKLIDYTKQTVLKKTGKKIELELEIVGEM